MSVEDNNELSEIRTIVLDEWSVSQFISAIDDYDIVPFPGFSSSWILSKMPKVWWSM